MSYWLLNTNKKANSLDQEKMIKEKYIALYNDNAKNIRKILKGDTIFLYEVKVGIICYGIARGLWFSRTLQDNRIEGVQTLEKLTILNTPLTITEIKNICGDINHRQAFCSMNDRQACCLIRHIENSKNINRNAA